MVKEIGLDIEAIIEKNRYREKELRDNLLEIEALKYLHKQLSTMATKLEKKHNTIIAERKAKVLELVSQYSSLEEAHEEYGWGYLSEEEYEIIQRAFKQSEDVEAEYTPESLAAFRLRDFLRTCNSIKASLEYDCMTDTEKAEYNKQLYESSLHFEKVHEQAEKIRKG